MSDRPPFVVLMCLAQHPASIKRGEAPSEANRHNVRIQPLRANCRPVMRDGLPLVVERYEEAYTYHDTSPEGEPIDLSYDARREVLRLPLRCPGCGKITVYEVLPPTPPAPSSRRQLRPDARDLLAARREPTS